MSEPVTGLDAELLTLATSVAREAGDLVLRLRREGVAIADTKSSATDIVTAADRASEELIRGRIRDARPGDGMLGEEGSDSAGTSGVRWVVDPIDGTVNYAHDLPNYAVSIGVEVDGETRVGVVISPAAGIEYVAVRGRGALRDGRPIRVAAPVPVERALVGTGFSYDSRLRAAQTATLSRLLPAVADIRRLGSCALDLCAVADGRLDAYVEDDIGGLWDYSAGRLIAEEAGAKVEVLRGIAGGTLLVAAPRAAYDAFHELVRDCGFIGT